MSMKRTLHEIDGMKKEEVKQHNRDGSSWDDCWEGSEVLKFFKKNWKREESYALSSIKNLYIWSSSTFLSQNP